MMFPGTYTTPFYREVRDLLHEQVRISEQDGSQRAFDNRARRSLQRRWERLLARQEDFRNAALPPLAAAAPAAAGLP
jgi:hypothetical protein